MKTIKIHALLFLALGFLLTACDEDSDEAPTTSIDNEELATVVEGALMAESQGLVADAADAVLLAERYSEKSALNEACNETFDSTVNRNFDNARITASYATSWQWTLNCNDNNIPQDVDFQRTAKGEYETRRMISSDSAYSSWRVDNLVQGANFLLEGEYNREGVQTSKIRNENTLTTDLQILATGIQIPKGGDNIASGTATFTLSGENTNGDTFSVEGEIVFNGDGTATIRFNGEEYTIEL